MLSLNIGIPYFAWGIKGLPVQLALGAILWARFVGGVEIIPRQIFKMPIFYLFLAYATDAALSITFAVDKTAALSDINARFWFAFVPLYIFACGPRRPQDAVSVLYVLMGASTVTALCSFGTSLFCGFKMPFYAAPFGVRVNHNPLGDICAVLMILSVSMLLTRRQSLWRWLSYGGVALGSLGLLGTWSRGAILAVLVAAGSMIVLSRAKTWQKVTVLVAMPLALLVAFKLAPENVQSYNVQTERSTISGRVHIYDLEWNYLSANPMKPVGIGNCIVTETKEVLDTFANIIMQDWIQLGVLGVILMLMCGGAIVHLAISNDKVLPQNSRLAAINLAAFGISVQYMIHALVDEFWTRLYNEQALFLAVGLLFFVRFSIDKLREESEHKLAAMMAADMNPPESPIG